MSKEVKRRFIKREIKNFFRLKPTNRIWHVAFLAALCVGFPLVFGLFIGRMDYAFVASLAGLVILYMPIYANFTNKMITLLLCSFGFMFCFGVGLLFSFHPILSAVVFGLLSAFVHWICVFYKVKPPRNFFFIMLASIASGTPFVADKIPEKIGLIAIGTIITCLFALGYNLLVRTTTISQDTKEISKKLNKEEHYASYLEAAIIGFFMFLSMFVGYLFQLENPYWIPISCLAVMQGASTYQIWKRGLHRILGTITGIGLCWGILSVNMGIVGICITIIVLQFIIEMLVTRHYALAVVFITPLTILLAEAAQRTGISTNELITARLIDTAIGITIGAVGGWVVYNEQLKGRAIKEMSKITKSK